MTLWSTFLQHDGRGVQKWTQYFPIYERHFARFRDLSVTMLEIGVNRGGSLQLWKSYLGPQANIVGVDIKETCKEVEESQISVRIGSQIDEVFLQSLVGEFGPFDIILDDGSHQNAHQIATMKFLYGSVAKNGVYMVEDTNTSYVDRYGGGLKEGGTFIEHCKDLIDELHGFHSKEIKTTDFTRTTLSMHIYDSVVAFEKGTHERQVSVDRGFPALIPKKK